MQAVIIAGGLATRLDRLTQDQPKSMIEILGKPFIQLQLELLGRSGFTDVVLCIGHFGEQIEQFVGSGKQFGIVVSYSYDGEKLLGTGGALKKAEPLLQNNFFLMWGDSYLLLDYSGILHEYEARNLSAMMVVYRNKNLGDRSNVILQDNFVKKYDKWNPTDEMEYIDNGLTVLNKSLLSQTQADEPYAIERLFAKLATEGKLGAYVTPQKFFEIGSISGIAELEHYLTKHKLQKDPE